MNGEQKRADKRKKFSVWMCNDGAGHHFMLDVRGAVIQRPLCGARVKIRPKMKLDKKKGMLCRRCLEKVPKPEVGIEGFKALLVETCNEKIAKLQEQSAVFNPYDLVRKTYDELTLPFSEDELSNKYGLVGRDEEEKTELTDPIILRFQQSMKSGHAEAGSMIDGSFVKHEKMLFFMSPAAAMDFMAVFGECLNDGTEGVFYDRSDEYLLEKLRETVLKFLSVNSRGAFEGVYGSPEELPARVLKAIRAEVEFIRSGKWESSVEYARPEGGCLTTPGDVDGVVIGKVFIPYEYLVGFGSRASGKEFVEAVSSYAIRDGKRLSSATVHEVKGWIDNSVGKLASIYGESGFVERFGGAPTEDFVDRIAARFCRLIDEARGEDESIPEGESFTGGGLKMDRQRGLVELSGFEELETHIFMTDIFMRYPGEDREALFDVVTPEEYEEFSSKCDAVAKELPLPPVAGANNVEITAMCLAHFFTKTHDGETFGLFPANYGDFPSVFRAANRFHDLASRLKVGEDTNDLSWFFRSWVDSGYARLELGHKSASNLALTDVPDGMAKPPWNAWSIVVPDGVIGDIARVWVFHLEPVMIVGRDGCKHDPTPLERKYVHSLIHASALALSSPEEFKKERRRSSSKDSSKQYGGKPDLTQATYLLSPPIPIEFDFREYIRETLENEKSGRKSHSLTSQHHRRGHWALQHYGEKNLLVKTIWRRPTWVGPRGAKILLRGYKEENEDEGALPKEPSSDGEGSNNGSDGPLGGDGASGRPRNS